MQAACRNKAACSRTGFCQEGDAKRAARCTTPTMQRVSSTPALLIASALHSSRTAATVCRQAQEVLSGQPVAQKANQPVTCSALRVSQDLPASSTGRWALVQDCCSEHGKQHTCTASSQATMLCSHLLCICPSPPIILLPLGAPMLLTPTPTTACWRTVSSFPGLLRAVLRTGDLASVCAGIHNADLSLPPTCACSAAIPCSRPCCDTISQPCACVPL